MIKQTQKTGDGSTNLQATEIVVHQGLTYSEAKEVALDVFRANFYEMAGKAQEIARQRAEQITDEFLLKLQKENPNGFSKSEDPDFQHSLFTVQKEYARNGDAELGDLLVDLLVDRSKQEQRNILQIVLNESLEVAPKLTNDQLAVLAVVFLFRYTQNYSVGNHQLLGEYFDKHVQPFADKLSKNSACYQHLEFSGCGSSSIGSTSLEKLISIHYQGLFFKGFDVKEIESREISIGNDPRFFIQCFQDPEKLQIRANTKKILEDRCAKEKISDEDMQKLGEIFQLNQMTEAEIKGKCIEIRPYMESVFDVWESSAMKSLNLTSVGISIGHANIKRLVGEFSDLSIWIN